MKARKKNDERAKGKKQIYNGEKEKKRYRN